MNNQTYFMLVLAVALSLLVGAVAFPEPLNPALLQPPPSWGQTAYQRYFELADRRGFSSPRAVLAARLESAAQAWAANPKAARAVKRAAAALRPSLSTAAPPASPGKPGSKLSASWDLPSGQLFVAWTSPSFALEGRLAPHLTLALRLPAARLSAAFSAASGQLSERLQLYDRLALLASQGRHESLGFELTFNF